MDLWLSIAAIKFYYDTWLVLWFPRSIVRSMQKHRWYTEPNMCAQCDPKCSSWCRIYRENTLRATSFVYSISAGTFLIGVCSWWTWMLWSKLLSFWHSQNSFVNEVLWWMIFTARYLSPFLHLSSWLKTTSDGTRTWSLQLLDLTEQVLHRHSCVAICIVDTIWIIKHFKSSMWVTYFKFYQTSSEVNLNSSSKPNNSNHQIHSSDKYQIIECKSMPSTLRLPLLLN